MIRLPAQIRSKLRHKLLLLVLFPILLVLPLTLGLAVYWSNKTTYEQLFIKVNTDLSVAQDVFARIQQDYLDELGRLSESYAFRTNLFAGNTGSVDAQLAALKISEGFDLLRLVALSEGGGGVQPLGLPGKLKAALSGQPVSAIQILDPAQLRVLDSELAGRVRLPLIETPRARPTRLKEEGRAMAMRMIYPIRDVGGRVIALLDGAVLLNGNFTFVDTIRDLIYGPGRLPEDSIGTVTVFLDDVRINTNVPLRPDERALGTRVSNEVRTLVLEQGEPWIDRAFVVNDWYISGYAPILDASGQRVGMLYAGFLEAPFRNSLARAIQWVSVIFLIVVVMSAVLAIQGAKSIFGPIERMSRVVRATRAGKDVRIGDVSSEDEIGELARGFDAMLDRLQQRNRQIRKAADQLEVKVEQRTRELRQKNLDLQRTVELLRATRQQLAMAEKLAALGELTAGVAHEINNPTAVILGNIDVLVAELGDAVAPVSEEVDLIIAQVYRIREIINNLLQYSRPAEYVGYLSEVAPGELIEETLALVNHALRQASIEVRKHIGTDALVSINRQELQQVLVNLVVNACHAAPPEGGVITIEVNDWDDKGVVIAIRDNGSGIDRAAQSKLFDPFYSTKPEGEGTGLGLSISYGLIRRYGGNITVSSRLGEGAEFRVWLLREPSIAEDEETIMEQVHSVSAVSS